MRISGRTYRFLRTSSGYTVRRVARMTGFSPAYISSIETGKRPITQEVDFMLRHLYGVIQNERVAM